ncbi:MAG: aconitase family protein, partial [Chitinivibrionales bacterium]
QIQIDGTLGKGVYAKDIILNIMAMLGVKGGLGYAYEYAGPAIEALSMEERMTICNMSIEGGARAGYVNPDQTTFDYIRGRPYAPQGENFERAVAYWKSIASDNDAQFDDIVTMNVDRLEPMVTWGINPGQAIPVTQTMPIIDTLPENDREAARKAYNHMGFEQGTPILGMPVDVAFLGSCTNSRISDLREAARIVEGKKVAPNVDAMVVPGSQRVKLQAEDEGLDKIFTEAGFSWRNAGCSMCLGMNPDKLSGDQVCASSSNRNFIGRQGSPKGRTLLMSPAMVAAAAINGRVSDVREIVK